jgi:hypothetical protein
MRLRRLPRPSFAASWLLALSLPLVAPDPSTQAQAQVTGAEVTPVRVTLVEHPPALIAQPVSADVPTGAAHAISDPTIARLARPGWPTFEAHRFLRPVHVGESISEPIEVSFHGSSTLRSIAAGNDFRVLAGGSCREDETYSDGSVCTAQVAFTPRGPGHRAGRLTFRFAQSPTPASVGLQGVATGPALAFTPAQITTVPQTYPHSGDPQIWIPGDVLVDEGDNLYFSDVAIGGIPLTGANTHSGGVFFLDSSGTLVQLAGQGKTRITGPHGFDASTAYLQQPVGIAADSFLNLYIAESGNDTLDTIQDTQIGSYAGLGATLAANCTKSAPCAPSSVELLSPFWVLADPSGNVYLNDSSSYYSVTEATGQLYDSALSTNEALFGTMSSMGLDPSQNFYGTILPGIGQCKIGGWDPSTNFAWDAAGNGACGFAGNSVRSQSAETGKTIGGFASDQAGDLYFADSANNVLRRIDAASGLIRTIAGNHTLGAGFTGDNGPATDATLNFPWGVAVDSNGIIYTASYTKGAKGILPQAALQKPAANPSDFPPPAAAHHAAPGASMVNSPSAPDAVIRQIGPNGQRVFTDQLVGKPSPPLTVLLTNVGNEPLNFTDEVFGGSNPQDFALDPATSSCSFPEGLAAGESCQLGFVFTPQAAGVRAATYTIVDNTAMFENTILLSGAGFTAKIAPGSPSPARRAVSFMPIGLPLPSP